MIREMIRQIIRAVLIGDRVSEVKWSQMALSGAGRILTDSW